MKKILRRLTTEVGRYHSGHFRVPETSNLCFFLNGSKVVVEKGESVELSLAQYLRNTGSKSVKIGCEEGGCGACCVISQYLDPLDNSKIISRSINSCLTSLNSVHGKNIITLEGLKDSNNMQMIQNKFVDLNATQCGFCTPGFEIAIYSAIANNQVVTTEEEWDEILGGNLCRCTGYRPIIDCCREVLDKWNKDESLEDYFPEELFDQMFREATSFFSNDTTMWFYLTELHELLEIKDVLVSNGVDCNIINGGTELMLESNLLGRDLDILLYTGNVEELCIIEESDEYFTVGASVTLRDLEDFCKEKLSQNNVFEQILKQLKRFAGRHVRNVASLGGNIVNASPTSDLNPIWLALGARFVLVDVDGNTRKVEAKDFFKSYRTVDLKKNEVLFSVEIPFLKNNEILYAFKQSRRREDDIAIQNGCFRIRFSENGVIEDSCFGMGCMNVIPMHDASLSEFLKGKKFDKETFQDAMEYLKKDFPVTDNAPGGMIEYRRSLLKSFFYKFFLKCQHEIYGGLKPEDPEFSAIEDKKYDSCTGTQFFKEVTKGTAVGKSFDHIYARPQVTGEAVYIDDMPLFPNELHLGLVLSDRPKGIIENIDVEEALGLKGVEGWIDYRDIPGENAFGVQTLDEELMISKEVTSSGQILGAIVARDVGTARKAARKVDVSYKDGSSDDPIITIDEAIEEKSFFDFHPKIIKGDVEEAFKNCENVKEGVLYCGGQEHFYLEPQASISIPEENDQYTVHCSTQNVCATQHDLNVIMGTPQAKIVVKTKRLGGGFGGKESRAATYAACATVAAKKFGRPCRVVLDRHQDMISSGQRHPFKCSYKVGYDSDGTIKAIDADLYSNAGFSTDLSCPVMERALMLFDNFYDIENLNIRGFVCKTNKPSNTAMRGFGGPQGLWVAEYIMHDVAKECKMDPSEIRVKHMYNPENNPKTPFGMDLVNCETNRIWEYISDISDFQARKALVEEFNSKNRRKKRGIYSIPIKFGISFAQTFLNQGHSLVHVYRDGSCLVSHGGIEMGQALHTKVAQVAATTLGIPMEKVNIIETASDKTANAPPTSASCGSDLNSGATEIACKKINENLAPLKDAMGYPEKATWEEICNAAFFERISLSAHGHFKTPGLVNMDWETGQGKPFSYYTYSAACSEVEIDTLTGDCKILRTDVVFDCGESLNPKIDIGQVEGAFVQGLGWVLSEELVFGGSEVEWFPEGILQSRGPGFYKIPTANDIPLEFNVHLLPESENPFAVMSSKGLGEPPFCLGLSLYFAVREAVEEARKDNGLANIDDFTLYLPCSAERIRMACVDEFSEEYIDGEDYVAKGTY